MNLIRYIVVRLLVDLETRTDCTKKRPNSKYVPPIHEAIRCLVGNVFLQKNS